MDDKVKGVDVDVSTTSDHVAAHNSVKCYGVSLSGDLSAADPSYTTYVITQNTRTRIIALKCMTTIRRKIITEICI